MSPPFTAWGGGESEAGAGAAIVGVQLLGSAVLKPQVLWHFGAGRWVGLGCRFKGLYPWPRHLIAVPLCGFPSLLLCPSSVK